MSIATGDVLEHRYMPEIPMFKRNVYWGMKGVKPPQKVAGFRAVFDGERFPALAVGVCVEQGSDRDLTGWDWLHFQKRLPELGDRIISAQKALDGQLLMLWSEFVKDKHRGNGVRYQQNRYFVLINEKSGPVFYDRRGTREFKWPEIAAYLAAPNPKLWGHLYVMRSFGLSDCRKAGLPADDVIQVCKAMVPIYRLWRGQ
jgi:hypothetical protein